MQFERGRGMGVPYDASARRLREACDASLRRLGTDRIDLYQVHRPDVLAHPAETAGILGELVTSGKVRHIGVSNYSAAQVRALRAHLSSGLDLVTIQPEYSAIHLDAIDDGVLDQAMELGLTPLACGHRPPPPVDALSRYTRSTVRARAGINQEDAVHPARSRCRRRARMHRKCTGRTATRHERAGRPGHLPRSVRL